METISIPSKVINRLRDNLFNLAKSYEYDIEGEYNHEEVEIEFDDEIEDFYFEGIITATYEWEVVYSDEPGYSSYIFEDITGLKFSACYYTNPDTGEETAIALTYDDVF